MRPDDMSASEHRAHAAADEKNAAVHQGRHDPEAEAEKTVQYGADYWDTVTYNPTEVHLRHASEFREHAEHHRAAAAELEEFEEAECKSFPPKTRGVCPLLGTVESTKDVDDGVSVRLSSKLKRKAALAHVRCHLAYARTKGRKGMDGCPLYLEGVKAEAGDGAQEIVLRVDDERKRTELRKRTRDHASH